MPPERLLLDAVPGENPTHETVQQIIEAESGKGAQGIRRAWQAATSNLIVLISDASGLRLSRDAGVTAPTAPIVDGTPAGGNLAGTYPNPTLSVAIMDALVPPGTIWAYGGPTAPAGWLPCNGTNVSRQTFVKLFNAIGVGYGAGDGFSTFTLPNLAGRVVLGNAAGHAIGTSGGAESVPAAAGPAHTHPGSHSHAPGAHVHGMSSHTHLMSSHTHTLNGHQHGMAGHQHGASALGVGGTVGGPTTSPVQVNVVTPGTMVMTDQHGHSAGTLDVNGTTDGNSGNTDGNNSDSGGNNSATAAPSVTNTGTPSLDATATDATAPAATYTGTIPTMPPFGVALFIIRAGS